MTDLSRHDLRTDERIVRRTWVEPAVRSLRAGAAEDGADTLPDGAQPS